MVCTIASQRLAFIINIFIHVIILFGFLTVFFNMIISKVMSNTFKNEIGHIIHDNLGKELRDKYSKLDATTKQYLKQLDMKKLEAYFNQPSKHIAVQNKWIKRSAIAITFVLIIMVAMLFFVLKYSCQTCIPLIDIIKENLIVFAFVGAVEYFFFTKIAMKFIPAPPSLMVRTFIESVQKEFSH